MRLTERDRVLLSTLQNYGCMTAKQIAARIFPGVALTTVLRRLRALKDDGYIQCILGLENAERLWTVGRKSFEKVLAGPAKLHFPRAILEHDATLSRLRLRLEESGIVHSWIPEHEIRSSVAKKYGIRDSQRRVIPDAIIGVEVSGLKESVALELELSPKNQRRYRQILEDYSYKESLWAVWYVVSSRTLMNQILSAQKGFYYRSRGPKILFSELQTLIDNPENAPIGNKTDQWKICDLLQRNQEIQSAQLPAHLVSGPTEKTKLSQSSSTTEFNEQTLAR